MRLFLTHPLVQARAERDKALAEERARASALAAAEASRDSLQEEAARLAARDVEWEVGGRASRQLCVACC